MAKSSDTLTPRRQRRRERNREALRQAARAVFERKGYVDATIQDLIDEADIGRGTFYNYFDSKDEIFADLVQELVNELVQAATEIGDEKSIRSRLHIGIGGIIRVAKRNRKMLAAVGQAIHVNADHAKAWSQLHDRLEKSIARDLDWCKRHGMIDDQDTDMLAMILTGMLESTLLEFAVRGPANAQALENALVDVYWNSVFRPHEGADDYTID